MAAIIIFGGTTEGRELAEALAETQLEVHLCVATDYGASLLPRCDNIKIHTGKLESKEMEQLLQSVKPELVVDATHPYAAAVTENIQKACRSLSCSLLCIERESANAAFLGKMFTDTSHDSTLSKEDASYELNPDKANSFFKPNPETLENITFVGSVEEAAQFLGNTQGKILITTGSKELEKYAVIADYQNRCVARVLPLLSVMEKCAGLGFTGKNLIAMQGPFSEEMNYQMLKQTDCRYLVTKDSGKEGRYEEKCRAVARANAKLVVIKRPAVKENGVNPDTHSSEKNIIHTMTLWKAIEYLSARYGLAIKRTAYLIGAGPGSAELFTGEAIKYLRESDCIIGAERVLQSCSKITQKPQYCAYKTADIAAFLRKHREYQKAALVYSGDIGFYSGAMGMTKALESENFRVVPVSGVSTVQYFLDKIGAGWQDAELASCHGKHTCLIPLLLQKGKVFTLLGGKGEAVQICRNLLELGLGRVRITVGEKLSYPEERIVRGTPGELLEMKFDSLCVMYLELQEWESDAHIITPGLADDGFVRNFVEKEPLTAPETAPAKKKVPMTKQGIRILSLAKLELTEDALVYDIGAGTGSVSVEAARLCVRGMVYAIEQKREAAALLEKNRVRFHAENMKIIEGSAPEILASLPVPTHVFIGGSNGSLMEIIQAVREKNPAAKFVVNAVTLETIAQICRIPETFPEYQNMEVLYASLSRGRHVGKYHMMETENSVMIACFGGGSQKIET